MNERQPSPWAVPKGSPIEQLELRRTHLASLHENVTTFAREKGITYELNDKRDNVIELVCSDDNIGVLVDYIEQATKAANEFAAHHGEDLKLVLAHHGGALMITAEARS